MFAIQVANGLLSSKKKKLQQLQEIGVPKTPQEVETVKFLRKELTRDPRDGY
jgi:hypothetical protein